MSAEIVKIDPAHPDRAFSRAGEALSLGGVIVYPTDTFYGLGVDPKNPEAVKRLFEIKGREGRQPILLLIGSTDDVRQWAEEVNEQAERLIKMFWPGPLTIVFKAKKEVLPVLSAGTGTIGLRLPGSEMTLKLLAFLQSPLTGTSANLSGGYSPSTVQELDKGLRAAVDLILDGGPTPGGRPSTVVDASGGEIRMIREGAIKIADSGAKKK